MDKVVCEEFLTSKSGLNTVRWSMRLEGNSATIDPLHSKTTDATSTFADILHDTFLPVGYPTSVRKEYLTYQIWDSIQGMSSYLRSVLTTRSVLAGAGVGSASTSALTAALAWVFRDGIGMVGSLIFAYMYADAFEVYIKEWRYLADVLNNVGLTLDLVSSHLPHYYVQITSVSTLCKACCGLIAGATKARISAHFARPGHLADVTAKESTQETAVALCGLVLGMVLAQIIGNDDVSVWVTFLVLLALHQYSNYHLVKVLVFSNINPQRSFLLVEHSFPIFKSQKAAAEAGKTGSMTAKSTSSMTTESTEKLSVQLPPPSAIAKHETFARPVMLSFFGPVVGGSLQQIVASAQFIVANRSGQLPEGGLEVRSGAENMQEGLSDPKFHCGTFSVWSLNMCGMVDRLFASWAMEQFVVGVDPYGRVIVALQQGITREATVKAHLVGCYVHHRLRVPSTLRLSSHSSRHRFLTEVYQYLFNTLAQEALQWYASLKVADCAGDADDKWDLTDVSALSVGGYRYSCFERCNKKDD
jgi:hypothetical protein